MTTVLVVLASLSQAAVEWIRRILPGGSSPLFVATVISLVGGFIGLSAVLVRGDWRSVSWQTIGLSAAAGLLVLLLDIFLVTAYARGLKLSVGIPLFLGATVLFGFVFSVLTGDKISWLSVGGACLILLGSAAIAMAQGE